MRKKDRLVEGVGVNDADYPVVQRELVGYSPNGNPKQRVVWYCPFYRVWAHMLYRCYSKSHHKTYPSYQGCSVSEDWKYFSKFRTWMATQDWEGKHLDKDLLFPGNKVYSQATCVFVSARINTFILERKADRGDNLIGVCHDLGKFKASISNGSGGRKHLGRFDTELEAHQAWLKEKLRQSRELAAEILAEGCDPRIAKALIDKYENYTP